MANRPSRLVLVGRTFGVIFAIMFAIAKFFNALSGMNMFPLPALFLAAMMLTTICTVIGWLGGRFGRH